MEVIEKFKRKHGNKYDYSLVKYVNAKTKVVVICPSHGEFQITPNNHLSGYGCVYCSGARISFEDYAKRARMIHGDLYEYRQDENGKPIITCSIHGDFRLAPWTHLVQQSICPECAKIQRGFSLRKTQDKFIEDAKKIHGELFSYEKVAYAGAHKKIVLICNKHGEFQVTPANHVGNKVGCSKCKAQSKSELLIQDYFETRQIVYEMQKSFDDLYDKSPNHKLKFDFYIPSQDLLIEYDGEGHFFPYSYDRNKSGEEQLQSIRYRDSLKDFYCKENNKNLLRIRYDQDIVTELDKIFNQRP